MATPPPYNPYDGQNNNYGYAQSGYGNVAASMQSVMKQVYLKMTLGLLVTAFVSLFCATSPGVMNFMFGNSWTYWGLLIGEIVLVIAISAGINKMSSPVAALLFYVFSAVNGLALAPIFLIYTHVSIAKTFFITAGMFGGMSVYGYFTNRDLSRMGAILGMAVWGLIIALVVNMFMHSDTFGFIISIAGVLIFVGLTAWDTQAIRRISEQTPAGQVGRVSTLGALTLYLDFINLFIYLLRLFGQRR